MARTARSTCPRCLGSPISNVKRDSATRSLLVVTLADRMLTCWSDSTRVTSDSSLVRSSASTWIATRNTDPSVGAQCTSTTRSRWVSDRWARFAQSVRCTDTPWPWVTKPVISSPGTGVQQRDSRTHTSGAPVTSTPESPLALVRGGEVFLRAREPADRLDQLLHHRLGAHLALAHRRVQRRDVGVAQVAGQGEQRVGAGEPLQRQALLAHRPRDLVLARLDRGFPAFLGEPLPDLVPRPRAL